MYVDILILAHLTARPAHGYEIKKSVERSLGSGFAINNNILYPALKRFEEMGAVSREVERQLGRPDRHVYRITERGAEVLQGLLRDFPPELARDDNEFHTRVAFFHLLDPPARLEILRARASALRGRLDHFAWALPEAERDQMRWGVRVVAFLMEQVQHELAWIDTLARETEQEAES